MTFQGNYDFKKKFRNFLIGILLLKTLAKDAGKTILYLFFCVCVCDNLRSPYCNCHERILCMGGFSVPGIYFCFYF